MAMPARDRTIHRSGPSDAARMQATKPPRDPTCIAPRSTAHRAFAHFDKGGSIRAANAGDLLLLLILPRQITPAKNRYLHYFSASTTATAEAPRFNPRESMR
ncbi:hypothetical protein [Lysobacter sp. Root690]|uniref:hypothetical protein n=1 Tax=Lysobacter sp. Root690 TaxID=1736588 RepID=UPI0012F81967|nr:hypothetical protein [Lysobacter sp. Root690]